MEGVGFRETATAALFLPGAPGSLPMGAWPLVSRLLAKSSSLETFESQLSTSGLWEAAGLVASESRLSMTKLLLGSGRLVLGSSSLCPSRWTTAQRLPPVFWSLPKSVPLSHAPAASPSEAEGLERALGEQEPARPSSLASSRLYSCRPWLAIVGSRRPSERSSRVAVAAAEWASFHGLGVLSGGASGVDSLAAAAALGRTSVLEILPFGLPWSRLRTSLSPMTWPAFSDAGCFGADANGVGRAIGDHFMNPSGQVSEALLACSLEAPGHPQSLYPQPSSFIPSEDASSDASVSPSLASVCLGISGFGPGEGFSSRNAMERNRWIYCGADIALVIQPRFKTGGSWHGAVGALRQRHPGVAVFAPASCPAALALAGLGASHFHAEWSLELLPEFLEESLHRAQSTAGQLSLSLAG